jgi:hypothetical protein
MAAATIDRPAADEYHPYYGAYVDRVPEGADVLALLAAQVGELDRLLRPLTDAQANSAFAPGEWTIKEVVGHLVDCERMFSLRPVAFARRDPAALPSFEQDDYVRAADFDARPLGDLLDGLALLRRANVLEFRHLTPETARLRGTASGRQFSVRSLVYILAGHVTYHLEDLREKYLPALQR